MKVAIVSLGRVGSRIAFCLMKNKNVDEILLELCKLIVQVDEKNRKFKKR
jgi:malate/lactate dehydrogenase